MKRNITTVRVLVASPGDTKAERASVSEVVSDINRLIGQKEGFRLEQILWEQDSYPDVGTDAQDVINRQLQDYDIFLGIMSSRFGTPTKRADSGTEEEFNRAFLTHLTAQRAIKILFYFHNASVKLFDLDPYQLLQVHNFRNRLEILGVLYESYNTVEEFRRKLHNGLAQSVCDFLSVSEKSKRKQTTALKLRKTCTVALPDWEAQTNSKNLSVFPQWARYREVPLTLYPCNQLLLSGTFSSNSKFFRFGFKLLPIRERPFGNGSIQSDGNNILAHIGKNAESKDLFVTSYYNGLRLASDLKVMNYSKGRELKVKFSVSQDNVTQLHVANKLLFEAHISPDIKNRLLMLAWGDDHEFAVSFCNITLEYS